jgi:hypothetical protein
MVECPVEAKRIFIKNYAFEFLLHLLYVEEADYKHTYSQCPIHRGQSESCLCDLYYQAISFSSTGLSIILFLL